MVGVLVCLAAPPAGRATAAAQSGTGVGRPAKTIYLPLDADMAPRMLARLKSDAVSKSGCCGVSDCMWYASSTKYWERAGGAAYVVRTGSRGPAATGGSSGGSPDITAWVPTTAWAEIPAARTTRTVRVMVCRAFFLVVFVVAFVMPRQAAAEPSVVASHGDAYISQDEDGRAWTIGNDGVLFQIGLARTGVLQVLDLSNPRTGTSWNPLQQPDTVLTLSDGTFTLGAGDFTFQTARASASDRGVTLALAFVSNRRSLSVTRNYACYAGASVIEAWTVVEGLSGAGVVRLLDLNGWQLTVRRGEIRWLTGLEPTAGAPFTLHRSTLATGQQLTLGSERRSSETAVPWFAVQGEDADELFGGIAWSGAWALTFSAGEDTLAIKLGLGHMSTALGSGESIETPHAFFGTSSGSGGGTSAALRAFVENGVRGGRRFESPVTGNTWFVHAAQIDENLIREEIAAAARLGAELFVLDAGYYPRAGATDPTDFTTGLGSWTWDQLRFPSGLPALADYAHTLGLRFGLWVEPERVALSTVGRLGLAREEWLAMSNGRYDPGVSQSHATAAQICLADPRARQWVLDKLIQLIDQVHPDYLKWDNNFWINCNRAGHNHGSDDGNFQHVRGLYQILAALRERYPDLLIENWSGGGNRLDFGMLRYTDVGWMSDRTSPSTLVRHNLEGLATVFPAPYLFSFVVGVDSDNGGGPDLTAAFRSRMPGMLGLGFDGSALGEDEQQEAAREVGIYKEFRDIQADASTTLLSDQIQSEQDSAWNVVQPAWDVIEQVSDSSGSAVIFAFQTDPASSGTTVWPVGLRPDATYLITSVDSGPIGTATGDALMTDGIEVGASWYSAAHVLVLRVTSQ